MRFLGLFIFLTFVGCNADQKAINEAENRPTIGSAKAHGAEEDCDDKVAKTAEEKVEEAISLQGGDSGCTLE